MALENSQFHEIKNKIVNVRISRDKERIISCRARLVDVRPSKAPWRRYLIEPLSPSSWNPGHWIDAGKVLGFSQ